MDTGVYISGKHPLSDVSASYDDFIFYGDKSFACEGGKELVGDFCKIDSERYVTISEAQEWLRKIESLQEAVKMLSNGIPFMADDGKLCRAWDALADAKSCILKNMNCTTTDALLAQVAPDWDD